MNTPVRVSALIVALVGAVIFGYALATPGDQILASILSGCLMGLSCRLAVTA